MKKWIFLLALLAGAQAFAAEDTAPFKDCLSSPWPYSRKQSGADYQKLFLLTPRFKLEAFLIAEVTEELAPSALSYDLARFLVDTENDKMKKSFYEVLRWGADLYGPESRPKRMSVEKVCEIRARLLVVR
jgi:hypothetical protein